MNNRASYIDKRSGSIKIKRGAKNASTLRSQTRRELRNAALVTIFVLTAIGAGLVFAITPDISIAFRSRAAPREQANASDATARFGNIIIQPTAGQCERMIFDNKSGRFVEVSRSCNKERQFDEHSVPTPEGTIHRLDAISKSFQRSGD
jgi:hypothetical protein